MSMDNDEFYGRSKLDARRGDRSEIYMVRSIPLHSDMLTLVQLCLGVSIS